MTIEIGVRRNGEILLNGTLADLAQVSAALSQADPAQDQVLYSREDPGGDAPVITQDLMKLVVAHRLPVGFRLSGSLSVVDASGQPHPIPLPDPSPSIQAFFESLPALFPKPAAGQKLAVVAPALAKPTPENLMRRYPYAWPLAAIALAGNEVTVLPRLDLLDGHDALIVDSKVLDGCAPDWMAQARARLTPGARIHLFDRQENGLVEIVPSRFPPGYRYAQPDGEASYANCLLTTMAYGHTPPVTLNPGEAVPHLAGLTSDEQELDAIGTLPFRYETLDTASVIGELVKLSQGGDGKDAWTLQTQVITERGEATPRFHFRRLDGGALEITRG